MLTHEAAASVGPDAQITDLTHLTRSEVVASNTRCPAAFRQIAPAVSFVLGEFCLFALAKGAFTLHYSTNKIYGQYS